MLNIPVRFSNERRGEFFAILSGFFFSLIGYFGVHIIEENFSIANMLCWRFFISACFIACLLFPQRQLLKQKFSEIKKILAYGSFFYSIMSILYFMSSRYVGTGLSMVIFFTYPSMVMLLNWILYRTRITRIYYFASLIIFVGMILLVDLNQLTFDIVGIVLGLLSALFYAGYIVFTKKNQLPPLVSTLLVSIGSSLLCGLVAFFDHSFIIPTTWSLSINIIGIGILCTALPILFLLQALKYISSEKTSILAVLEPVFVVIFGVFLLDEQITLSNTVGILVILSGALMTLFSQEPEQNTLPNN
jgi:drug/metabolite transporter (DMT)-like permease